MEQSLAIIKIISKSNESDIIEAIDNEQWYKWSQDNIIYFFNNILLYVLKNHVNKVSAIIEAMGDDENIINELEEDVLSQLSEHGFINGFIAPKKQIQIESLLPDTSIEEDESIYNCIRDMNDISILDNLDKYIFSNLSDKAIMNHSLNVTLEQVKIDEHLFRLYGPVSTSIHINDCSDHPCFNRGGCRMFECNEFQSVIYEEDIDYSFDKDWFLGFCLSCDKSISNKKQACRMPLHEGSWMGCYCSWECVEAVDNSSYMIEVINMMKEYTKVLPFYTI